MDKPRHKRKESYTVLVVSNIDRKSRRFFISRSSLQVLLTLALVLSAFTVLLICQCCTVIRRRDTLRDTLKQTQNANEQLTAQWDLEKEQLNTEKQALESELSTLLAEKEAWTASQEDSALFHEPDENPELPTLYPSSGTSVLTCVYTEEHPYITFTAEKGTDIIAAGNGTVTQITSDSDHTYIIELSFDGGFKARYFCHDYTDLNISEGDSVAGKDVLFTVTQEQAELDYQILYEDDTIDPLMIIAAKG